MLVQAVCGDVSFCGCKALLSRPAPGTAGRFEQQDQDYRARGHYVRGSKEKKMKRTISLWLGLLAFAAVPVLAQAPPPVPTGKIHGHVINPTGAPQNAGTIEAQEISRAASGPGLSATTEKKAVFELGQGGEFTGELPAGKYNLIFRQPDTPPDKRVDEIKDVIIVAGQTTEQDVDMSRKEFVDQLPPDQKAKLEEIRKHNADALKVNEVIKNLNADLKQVTQNIHDADGARAAAQTSLAPVHRRPTSTPRRRKSRRRNTPRSKL